MSTKKKDSVDVELLKRKVLRELKSSQEEKEGLRPDWESCQEKDEDPCWEGYEMVGTKVVDGEEVPNCVPIDE